MSVIYEITDLSEFNREKGPALYFVWDPETGDGYGSDASNAMNAVDDVARYCDTGTDDYPRRWRYTAGDNVHEVLIERRVSYVCSNDWLVLKGSIQSPAFGRKEVEQKIRFVPDIGE